MFPTWDVWSYPRIAELHEMPRSFSNKLHSKTQVSDRLGMSGGRSPRHAQNPVSVERRKALSITHHALSPSHHHLYIISSHQLTKRGEGCHLRVVPPGQLLRRPSTPKPFIKPGFVIFFAVKFFVFAFRWFFTEVVMFIFE